MPEKPVCEECEAAGDSYGVHTGLQRRTLMARPEPYWDEDGNYVEPEDPNYTIVTYRCSNGHEWQEKRE